MGKIIVIANHKGGVAKTTTSINFGAALVHLGKRVLLVDMDPQCNLTETMQREGAVRTVYDAVLSGGIAPVVSLKEGLDMVPGDKAMLMAETRFGEPDLSDRRQLLLKTALDPLRSAYDFIIVDTPPSRGIVTVNALACADEVIIPTLSEIMSVRGMKDINELIVLVRDNLNPVLSIAGLLLVQYGDRTTASRKTAVYVESIAGFLDTKLFRTRIRKNVAVVESQMAGTDIFVENSLAKAAQDYLSLAKEYLGIE